MTSTRKTKWIFNFVFGLIFANLAQVAHADMTLRSLQGRDNHGNLIVISSKEGNKLAVKIGDDQVCLFNPRPVAANTTEEDGPDRVAIGSEMILELWPSGMSTDGSASYVLKFQNESVQMFPIIRFSFPTQETPQRSDLTGHPGEGPTVRLY